MGLARFSIAALLTAVLTAVGIALPGESPAFELPALPPFKTKMAENPWRLTGDLGYSYERILEKNTKPVRNDRHTANLKVGKGLKGFVWQPWILRWDTNTAVGGGWFKDTTWDHNIGGDDDIRKSNVGLTRTLDTDYALQILPETRFPLAIKNKFVYKDTTEAKDGNGGDLSYDHSVEQQASTEDGATRGSLKWRRTRTRMGERNRPGLLEHYLPYVLPGMEHHQSESLLDGWDLNAAHQLKGGDLSLNGRSEKRITLTDTTRTTTRDANLVVRNSYNMGTGVFLDSQFNAGRTRAHNLTYVENKQSWKLLRAAHKTLFEGNRAGAEEFLRRAVAVQVRFEQEVNGFTGDPDLLAQDLKQQGWQLINRDVLVANNEEEQTNTHWYQWNNTTSWRPEESKFSLTLTNRGYYTTNTSVKTDTIPNGAYYDLIQEHGNKTNLISANLGISGEYAFTDNLRASATVTTDVTKNKTISHSLTEHRHVEATDWNRSNSPNLQLSYSADNRNLGPFQYNWNASSGWGIVFARDQEPDQVASEQVGHSLSRAISLSRTSRIDFQMSESAGLALQSNTRAEESINHGFNVRWSREHENNRTMISLDTSDNRFWGADKGQRQMWNLQITRTGNLDSGMIWSGDITLQWNREKLYGEDSEIQKTGSASLSLQQPNLFDVAGLTANSTLRINAPLNLYPFIMPYTEQTIDWQGQVDYRIGMLQLALKAQYQALHDQHEGEEHEGLIFVEMKRYLDKSF